MRRTRVAAGALAGSLWLAAFAPAATAAEPRAEISPHRVRPGETVTITVTCPKHDEKVGHITAYSQAFVKGEAELKRVRGGAGGHGDARYSGTARITSSHHRPSDSGRYGADDDGSDAYGSDSGYGRHGSDDGSGSDGAFEESGSSAADGTPSRSADASDVEPLSTSDAFGSDGTSDDAYGTEPSGSHRDGSHHDGSRHHEKRYAVNGSCPGGKDFSGSVVVATKPRGGAHAGQGGSRSAPGTATVAAGGALLSAALGLGVYTLRRRRPRT